MHTASAHSGAVTPVASTSDRGVVSFGDDGTVHFWSASLEPEQEIEACPTANGKSERFLSVACDCDRGEEDEVVATA